MSNDPNSDGFLERIMMSNRHLMAYIRLPLVLIMLSASGVLCAASSSLPPALACGKLPEMAQVIGQ